LTPQQRLIIGAVVLITGAGGFGAGRALFRPKRAVTQPIAFNHQKHVEDVGMECGDCHLYFDSGEHSGLPALSLCLACHEEPVTESPEEKKILELAEAGEDDVFRKLFRLPDHAFYSHRRHVKVGEIDCQACHGDVAATTSPPEVPLIRITMDFCMDCHKETGIAPDCTDCHR
jgi:hypothetical protein